MSINAADYIARRVANLREDSKARLEACRERVTNGIADGYVIDAFAMKALAHAQARARAVFHIRCAEDADHETLMKSLRNAREQLQSQVLMAARGAGDSGEMNSTCSVTRAVAAVGLSAAAEVLETIEALVDFQEG